MDIMPSKHWTLVGGAVACLIVSGYSSAPAASPWINPGDAYARFKVQQAADRGEVEATVTTWPLSRANAKNDTKADGNPDQSLWTDLAGPIGGSAEVSFSGSTSPVMIRGFGGAVREKGELDISLEYVGDSIAVGFSPSYVPDPTDDENLRLDGSYLAGTFSNLTVGAGYIDRWWGPGWQSSMILSDNARPIPSVWLSRRNTQASESPWLSWLGPWHFTVFAGQLEEERVVPEAKLIGVRVNFRPLEGLEVGLSRLMQWGGDGRPESGSTLWEAIIGDDNTYADDGRRDPANQLAGIDVRYGFLVRRSTVGLYAHVVGDDEAGYLPSRKIYQFGLDWTTAFGGAEQQWFLEGVDTMTEGGLGGEPRPNYAYEHHTYKSGFRYLGRNIASTFDSDARALTIGMFHFFDEANYWNANITYAELNRDGRSRPQDFPPKDVDYFVPESSQDLVVLNLRYLKALPIGRAELQVVISTDDIELEYGELDSLAASLGWHLSL
ncbi:capsule assembly Wzi family protein [Marinobacter sp. F4216]|uniref:capsule assembly Wzi family protein n=1 Tax=Marinobacter sp. F4216 TaxID=2874281 RepID=UPI001CC00301|nr:capsule assembly Wzi family protein [Marinobacter sp. F4216]MBZ2168436.1 capsule assembly Wzi family protein [Marinobacter sp. F4216]